MTILEFETAVKRCSVAFLAGALAIGLVQLRGCFSRHNPAPTATLAPNEKTVVTYNDNTHVLTTVTSEGTKQQYAENPTIHVDKQGGVAVVSHGVGHELQPFIGLGWDTGPRLHLGASFFHFWRVDLNGALALSLNSQRSPRFVVPVISVSYNVFRNSNVFIGVDPLNIMTNRQPVIHGGVYLNF